MSNYKNYTELDVWVACRALVNNIYSLTKTFPKDELFGLISQMRRAALSISSNIAEGCGRQYAKETIQFLFIAKGSTYELETQLYISLDQSYISVEEHTIIIQELTRCKMLINGFINYFEKLK